MVHKYVVKLEDGSLCEVEYGRHLMKESYWLITIDKKKFVINYAGDRKLSDNYFEDVKEGKKNIKIKDILGKEIIYGTRMRMPRENWQAIEAKRTGKITAIYQKIL